jgi:hypothetical protein
MKAQLFLCVEKYNNRNRKGFAMPQNICDNSQKLFDFFSQKNRINSAFELFRLKDVFGEPVKFSGTDSQAVLNTVMDYPENYPNFKIQLKNDADWDEAIKIVNDSDGSDTFLGENCMPDIKEIVKSMLNSNSQFLQLHSGAFNPELWDEELIELILSLFKNNKDISFLASTAKPDAQSNHNNQMIDTLKNLQTEGRGILFFLEERAKLHFIGSTYPAYEDRHLARGYFEEDHSEKEVYVRKSHEFVKASTYFLFTGKMLRHIINNGVVAQ